MYLLRKEFLYKEARHEKKDRVTITLQLVFSIFLGIHGFKKLFSL